MFPIKYIDNNLVLNVYGEWFAYYELIPYNYSFLSEDEKLQLHAALTQMISQFREGNIHLLQIAAESSIANRFAKSKKSVTGNLQTEALERIDDLTVTLTDMVGDNQLDYKYYMGFKLIPDEDKGFRAAMQQLLNDFKDWYFSVNEKLGGDFTSISEAEINRFSKLENLICGKLGRRFRVRRCDKNDFGYILEYLYGSHGTAYEDYYFNLDYSKINKNLIIKKYDLIRPTECCIREYGRYLELDNDKDIQYVSYFTISQITNALEFPGNEVLYYQQQQFDFPVSCSVNIEVMTNGNALNSIRKKKSELQDLDNNAYQADSNSSIAVSDALDDVDELEADLSRSKNAMYKLSYILRVSADDVDELKIRCNIVKDFYDDFDIKLVRPFGDMIGLHGEFVPASHRYINDYIQYVKADFIATLGFGACQQLGETDGIYIGYNIDTGKNVYIKPALAAQGVKGSVTNALAAAFLGSLGGGKSFANNLIVYYAALYGAKAVVIDPKSERGGWKDALPDISSEIEIVNITSDAANAGMLDPYVIMSNIKDAEALALDILMFLTGISARDGERFSVLSSAVKNVTSSESRGLLNVIKELRASDTPISNSIAIHIESMVGYDFAHLLFSDGSGAASISLDKQLNVIQIADLILPDKGSKIEDYSTVEMLSVAMLIVISTFALDFIHSDRSIFKIVDLDEAWTFLQVAQGKVLANKLVREGRAMNAGVYFITQSASDLAEESMRNNIGMKFAFRSTDIDEIRNTLEFFGLDPDDEDSQKRLSGLENGQCLMQDIYGHVGVVQFHPVFSDIFDAFDTRPPVEV